MPEIPDYVDTIRRMAEKNVRGSEQGVSMRKADEIIHNVCLDPYLGTTRVEVIYDPGQRELTIRSDAAPLQRNVGGFGIDEFTDITTIADEGVGDHRPERFNRDRWGERIVALASGDDYSLTSIGHDGTGVEIRGTVDPARGKLKTTPVEFSDPSWWGIERRIRSIGIDLLILREALSCIETVDIVLNGERLERNDFGGLESETIPDYMSPRSFNGLPVSARVFRLKRAKYGRGRPQDSHVHVRGLQVPVPSWNHRGEHDDLRFCVRADGALDFLTSAKRYSPAREETAPLQTAVAEITALLHPDEPDREPHESGAIDVVNRAVRSLLDHIRTALGGGVGDNPSLRIRRGDLKEGDEGAENPNGIIISVEPVERRVIKERGPPRKRPRATRTTYQFTFWVNGSRFRVRLVSGWNGSRYDIHRTGAWTEIRIYKGAPSYRNMMGRARWVAFANVAMDAILSILRANEFRDVPGDEWEIRRNEILDKVAATDYYAGR